ncbi:MAG: DNA mismatch repair endonuclease MutL [Methanolinea sp.]|nr:DNA mismatch repair endonuclease MutL [Methanolinea sp.]
MTEEISGRRRIRLLDKETISRISAGEVVERPASVVKELVENALDAGAGRIEVEITSKGGHIAAIRVTDDGCGMSPEDAELSCVRHATSKIQSLEDLERVESFGFRGEALASIAAVSRLVVTTKTRDSPLAGVRVTYEGGTLLVREECGCPPGTTVEVTDLFYNTPARKKFMRSVAAEMAYITGIMERIILSHPSTSFRVLHNRRPLLSTPGGDLRDAALHIFGTECEKSLLKVDFSGTWIALHGLVTRPSFSRQNPYQIFISVNGRPIQSRSLSLAVREGYGTLMPSDRFPVAVLDITLDPSLVDVNVHPTKREVRISREHDVRAEITLAVRCALEQSDIFSDARDPRSIGRQCTLSTPSEKSTYDIGHHPAGGVSEKKNESYPSPARHFRQVGLTTPPDGTPIASDSPIPEMEVLGQLDASYILASPRGGEDLILIDQHAAHERVLYDRIIGESSSPPLVQELLAPVVLELSPREMALIPDLLPVLKKVGFSLEEFGGRYYTVHAVPVVLGRQIDQAGIHDLLSSILAGSGKPGLSQIDRVQKIVACRGAIKAGTVLSREQCEGLIEELRQTSHPLSCPHGRPTMVIFHKKDLDGLFLRT